MELEYVKEFVTLADTQNYLKAADQLFIAQSALSRHIQALEKELGVQLFNRTTRSIQLTEYGIIFLPYAKELLRIQHEFKTVLYNNMNNISGTIRIGCLPVTAPYHIPDILAKFQKENKNFQIELTKNDSLEQLRDQTVDFVFVRDIGPQDPDIVYLPFDSDSLAVLLPLDHPLASCSHVSLSQLKDECFLFLPKNTKMSNLCISACQQAGFEPRISYSGPSAENIVALAREHVGVGILSKKPLKTIDTSQIAIVDIEPSIITPISLCYLKKAKLSIGAIHFINCVTSFEI